MLVPCEIARARGTLGFVSNDLLNISLNAMTEGNGISNNCKKSPFQCSNPFPLTCINHGEDISVRCGRWRSCPGCSLWKQWTLKQRFIAGIEDVPAGKMPMFFTLTFPLDHAPDEDEAHRAWRSLVARLRYRGYLDAYGWVLQRQRNETLHFHGIAHLPWFADGLAEWRELLVKSRFGVQNKLVVADSNTRATAPSTYLRGSRSSRPCAVPTGSRLTSLSAKALSRSRGAGGALRHRAG